MNRTNHALRAALKAQGLATARVGTVRLDWEDRSQDYQRITVRFMDERAIADAVVGRPLTWTSYGTDRNGCRKGWQAATEAI